MMYVLMIFRKLPLTSPPYSKIDDWGRTCKKKQTHSSLCSTLVIRVLCVTEPKSVT